MKLSIEVMAGIATSFGSLFKALKRKYSARDTIINTVVGGFLSFGVVGAIMYWLPTLIDNTNMVIFISFCVGWVANSITDYLEEIVPLLYDILVSRFGPKEKKENKDEKH